MVKLPSNHPAIARLSTAWADRWSLRYATLGSKLSLALTPALLLATVWTSAEEHYSYYMPLMGGLFIIGLVNWFLLATPLREQRYFVSYALMAPPMYLLIIYVRFLWYDLPEYNTRILLSVLMLVIFGSLLLHRLWKEQYIFSVAAAISLVVTLVFRKGGSSYDLLIVVNCVAFSWLTMWVFRRDFYSGLFTRYHALCTLMPKSLARAVVLSADDRYSDEAFSPRVRYVVCICSDWRNFQNLASTLDPREICEAFEIYYDIVLRKLEAIAPDGEYYFDWSADELFCLFFSEAQDPVKPMERAFTFARALGTDIYEEARSKLPFELRLDVGMASGFGLVGLMGPKLRRKTTITASAAGIAKRLEEEAKALRQSRGHAGAPILVIEADLLEEARPYFGGQGEWVPLQARAKDVTGAAVHAWVPAGDDERTGTRAEPPD